MSYPFNSIPGTNPQNIGLPTPIGLQTAARNPTPLDNTFVPGSEWQNSVTGDFFKCVSSTISGAVWIPFVQSSSGNVSSLTGNSGGPIPPDGSGTINIIGTAGQINVVGAGNTLTLSLVGGGTAIDSFVPDSGTNPIVPTAAGAVTMAGAGSITTVGSLNTLTTQLTGLTNHAVLVGAGTTTITKVGPSATSGAIFVSQGAGSDPAFIAPGPTISAGGIMTNAVQPAFLVSLTTAATNVTGAGGNYILGTQGGGAVTTVFDQGSNITTPAGVTTFTAPVTGKYWFKLELQVNALSALNVRGACNIVTTTRTYFGNSFNIGAVRNDDGSPATSVYCSCLADMTAGNVATVVAQVTGGGGDTCGIGAGTTTSLISYFEGYLVC